MEELFTCAVKSGGTPLKALQVTCLGTFPCYLLLLYNHQRDTVIAAGCGDTCQEDLLTFLVIWAGKWLLCFDGNPIRTGHEPRTGSALQQRCWGSNCQRAGLM